jgi:hypothetical protein
MGRWRYTDCINAYDAVQVRVDFDNGMSINFHNNWITPPEFEGPVNQGHEIVGAAGKVESDQRYRGFRWWNKGGGSRTKSLAARSHSPHRDEGDVAQRFQPVGPSGVPPEVIASWKTTQRAGCPLAPQAKRTVPPTSVNCPPLDSAFITPVGPECG